jgi:hypothetical protein
MGPLSKLTRLCVAFDEAHEFETVFDRRRRGASYSGSSSGPSVNGYR